MPMDVYVHLDTSVCVYYIQKYMTNAATSASIIKIALQLDRKFLFDLTGSCNLTDIQVQKVGQ